MNLPAIPQGTFLGNSLPLHLMVTEEWECEDVLSLLQVSPKRRGTDF